MSFSFAFFIIRASLYHNTLSNLIFISLKYFIKLCISYFRVFTLSVVSRFSAIPLKILSTIPGVNISYKLFTNSFGSLFFVSVIPAITISFLNYNFSILIKISINILAYILTILKI